VIHTQAHCWEHLSSWRRIHTYRGHVIPVFLWKNRLSWRRRFSDAAVSKKASGHTCAGHDRVSRTWVAFCHQKLGDKSGQFAFLDGVGCIGGNKILVQDSSKDESLLLDLGRTLARKQVL